MRIYHTVDEILSDRRKGVMLSEIIESFLASPSLRFEVENPFDLILNLYTEDYLDATTKTWSQLPVNDQIKYSSAYQRWYAGKLRFDNTEKIFGLGHPDVFYSLIASEARIPMIFIPPIKSVIGNKGNKFKLIKKPFWLAKTEITQEQWVCVMPNNPSHYGDSYDLPVECVSWSDCVEFCEKTKLQLPNEERWELACRAGTTTNYSFGDDDQNIDSYAWFSGNTNAGTHLSLEKLPNAWGLYGMHGNVAEWCENKVGSASKKYVFRGGSWANAPVDCTSHNRLW